MRTIKRILDVTPYRLTLLFDNGQIREVDMEEKFREWSRSPDSKFRELLDPEKFGKVQLEEEFGSLYWKNGLDLCPDVLYALSEAPEPVDVVR